MPGMVTEYGLKRRANAGNYQRHLGATMGFRTASTEFYHVKTPGYPREENFGRREMDLPFRPPHEVLEKELQEDPIDFAQAAREHRGTQAASSLPQPSGGATESRSSGAGGTVHGRGPI